MLGFSYNGKHSDKMKVNYAPQDTDRGEIMSEYDVIDSQRSWVPGGDYYESRVKSKTFELECWYEWITKEELNAISRWLDRRTSGYLIFDERPWARYYVHPTKRVNAKDYAVSQNGMLVHSGTFTITFTAYWPFAELLYTDPDRAPFGTEDEIDLLPASIVPPGPTVTDGQIMLYNFLVYNPGTEQGQSRITFKGSVGSSDLTITNNSTGDTCSLKFGVATGSTKRIEIDSKTMRVEKVTVSNGNRVLDFEDHGGGYISFAPNRILRKNITVKTTSGSVNVTGNNSFTEDMVGAYIYLKTPNFGGLWYKITGYTSPSKIKVQASAMDTYTFQTYIITANELSITAAEDISPISLEVLCKPEVR